MRPLEIRELWAPLLALALSSCGGSDSGALVSDVVAGLSLNDSVAVSFDGHLVEMVTHAGYVYVANSHGVATLRLEADGGLTLTDDGKGEVDPTVEGMDTSCTALAVHGPSNTLYCSSDRPSFGEPRIERYSLADPAHPALGEHRLLDAFAVRDIAVVDDTLLINQFGDGLWTAEIADDGSLAAPEQTPVTGNVRFTLPVGQYLVSMLLDREGEGAQLRLLERQTYTELDRLELDGPPISIGPGGDQSVAVALGSQGVAIVDLVDGALVERLRLRPEAVSTHAMLSDDTAYAVTLSGTFAYELGAATPRLFGFAVESAGAHERNGNMLHGLIHDGDLLTSDWTHVQRWAVDTGGESVSLDVPRGVYVRPSDPVSFRMRNPGAQALRAEFWVRRSFVFSVDMAPGAVETVSLSAEQHANLMPPDSPDLRLKLRVFDPSVDSAGTPLSITYMTILDRDASSPPAAIGEPFPSIVLSDIERQMFELPQTRPLRLVWNTTACALMWPEFEDLAWAQWADKLDTHASGTPILIAPDDVSYGFAERWGLAQLEWGQFGPDAPPEVNEINASYGGEDLMATFIVTDLPGDSDTSDYVLDSAGTVLSLERMYRGPYTLVAPPPTD